MADSRSELAFGLAVHALTGQREMIESLRVRAGTMLAAASLVTYFFGGQSWNDVDLTFSAVAAIVMFAVVVVLSLAVIVPWSATDWVYSIDADWVLKNVSSESMDEAHETLAREIQSHYLANHQQYLKLNLTLAAAGVALTSEILLWIFPF